MKPSLFFIIPAFAVALLSCQKSSEQEMALNSVRTGKATDITETSVKLSGDIRLEENADIPYGFVYSTKPNPEFNKGYIVSSAVAANGIEINGQHFSAVLNNLPPNQQYYYRAWINLGYVKYGEIKSFKTKGNQLFKAEAVDLGLSVKWSSMNLGANKPDEYGYYYAWGETTPKSVYSLSTYMFGTSQYGLSRYNTNSSYGAVDNKTEFKDYDYEDDAARQKLGGKWRTPTAAEWRELMNNCTCVETNNYNHTGVKGRIVTAANGNSIFLPYAGDREGSSYYYDFGSYWSSASYADYPNMAWGMSLPDDRVCAYHRWFGHSIRPVTD